MRTSGLETFFDFAATTAGVTVRVAVSFMPDQSRIEHGSWFWAYHVRIENGRADAVRLRTRHWQITDAAGGISLVDGEGVVGETPLIAPGQAHDYVSGCELTTRAGGMAGFYTFTDAAGLPFRVAIPHFGLDAPAQNAL